MQLTQLATLTALIMTVSAAVPGVRNLRIRDQSEDLVELVSRSSCSNKGKLKRPTKFADQGCVPEKSRGFLSSHNCANKGGTAYLCVQGGRSFCISGKSKVKSANYENGECFL